MFISDSNLIPNSCCQIKNKTSSTTYYLKLESEQKKIYFNKEKLRIWKIQKIKFEISHASSFTYVRKTGLLK